LRTSCNFDTMTASVWWTCHLRSPVLSINR